MPKPIALSGVMIDFSAIKAELDKKFTGSVYSANCSLSDTRSNGDTVWVITWSPLAPVAQGVLTGVVTRFANGVTYAGVA